MAPSEEGAIDPKEMGQLWLERGVRGRWNPREMAFGKRDPSARGYGTGMRPQPQPPRRHLHGLRLGHASHKECLLQRWDESIIAISSASIVLLYVVGNELCDVL